MKKVTMLSLDTTKFNSKYINQLINQRDMKHLGLIAQEVQKIVPELVNVIPDGTLAIEYNAIIGLLIEAIKEQDEKIEALLYRLTDANLKSTNSEVKSMPEDNSASFLFQNAPNPFNKTTVIKYKVTLSAKEASILLFNLQGLLIKTIKGLDLKGDGEITISGFELRPGMYMYSLIVDGSIIDTKRMILTFE